MDVGEEERGKWKGEGRLERKTVGQAPVPDEAARWSRQLCDWGVQESV